MKWWKITYFRSDNSQVKVLWKRADTDSDCSALAAAEGFGYRYELREAIDGEVPSIIKGLTEATTEQLKRQLNLRGWKVVLR